MNNTIKRIIIFDGCSMPFGVVWTKKYSKKEIKEIANYMFFLKEKVFTNKYVSQKVFCHIESHKYAEYFQILGISAWKIASEELKKEYNLDLFWKESKKISEKFFEKYTILETYKDCKEINSEYILEKYKDLDFGKLEKIFYAELEEALKMRYKPREERLEILKEELYYMNMEIRDSITALNFLEDIEDKEIFLKEIKEDFDKTSKKFMQWYEVYFNIISSRV